jgi:hypothetical protein
MNLQMSHDLRHRKKALPMRVRKSIEENMSALACDEMANQRHARSPTILNVPITQNESLTPPLNIRAHGATLVECIRLSRSS